MSEQYRHNIPARCELCSRHMNSLSKHHLIPKMLHANRRIKKKFSREEMTQRILWLCRPCHSHVHRVFSEKELALHYNSRDALHQHAAIQVFVNWIRCKPAGFKPKSGCRRSRR